MIEVLFDPHLISIRRQRADRLGRVSFLAERAFDDIVDRLGTISRQFRHAVLFGNVEDDWPGRLMRAGLEQVSTIRPDTDDLLPNAADLCISIGALDTAEPLPAILAALRHAIAPDALLIGAIVGGQSFPVLRTAMLAADQAQGRGAAPHLHPRIDGPSLAGLLTQAGFTAPVVDVDRVSLSYASFDALVRDLRGMAATNRLISRSRQPIMRNGLQAARAAFAQAGDNGRTIETVELLHFAAWTPSSGH